MFKLPGRSPSPKKTDEELVKALTSAIMAVGGVIVQCYQTAGIETDPNDVAVVEAITYIQKLEADEREKLNAIRFDKEGIAARMAVLADHLDTFTEKLIEKLSKKEITREQFQGVILQCIEVRNVIAGNPDKAKIEEMDKAAKRVGVQNFTGAYDYFTSLSSKCFINLLEQSTPYRA